MTGGTAGGMARGGVRSALVGAVAAVLALTAAGCGGGPDGKGDDQIASAGGRPTSSQATAAQPTSRGQFYDAQLKYTQCMRRHGMADFPDPTPNGYMDHERASELYERLQSGSRAEMERNQRTKIAPAMKACGKLYEAAQSAAPRRDRDKDLETLRKHARCMREQGIDMTDPTLVNGQIMVGDTPNPTSPKVGRNTPRYKQARQACRSLLPEGLYQ
ncbi:hypothetical protein ACIBF1_45225 [Spirillospora sp. NPDC050679]